MYYLIFKGQKYQTGVTKAELIPYIGRLAPAHFYEILNEDEYATFAAELKAKQDAYLAEQAATNVQPDATGTQPA